MTRQFLRPLEAGARINIRYPDCTDWRRGSIRKRVATEYAEDSNGWLWVLRCVCWAGGALFECTRLAEPSDGWDAHYWYSEHINTSGAS